MNPVRVRPSRSMPVAAALAAAAASVALLALGCGPQDSADGAGSGQSDSDSDDGPEPSSTSTTLDPDTTETADTEAPVGWFEVGWGVDEFVPIADGDPFPIVLGGQGAQMFPMPLRGGEFYLPGNPTSWMDETGPLVDFEMDIEGWNDGPGGHFKYIANYTLDWIVLEDGTYQSAWMPIIVPDGVDPADIEGEPAHLWVRLRPHEQPSLEVELDVVVTVMPSG